MTSNHFGIIGSFETTGEILKAARAVRDAGYKKFDVYTPFPVHGLNEAMGLRDTRLPWLVLAMGIAGCLTGLWLQWWTMGVAYPFVVSGKPLFSLPAFIPVIFELTVLFSAFGAFFGMFIFNRLPRHYHPVFKHKVFDRVSRDRFYIAVEAGDPQFDSDGIRRLLSQLGARDIELLEA